MAKPLKIVLIVIGVFLALLFGGALAASLLFDPNDYRGQITEAVQKKTGRALELGNLDLDIFPWLAVSAENVKLGNAQGFGAEPFAEVGEAQVGVKLLPLLLDRKVEISAVTLSGLRLRLAVDKDGRNNWSDLSRPEEKQEPEPEEPEGAFKLEDLDIGGIDIEDGALSYSDAQAGKTYSLEKLRVQTGDISVGEPIDIDAGVNLSANAPAVAAEVSLKGQVDWNLEAQRYDVKDLELKIKGKGQKMLQGRDADFEATLASQLAAELGKQARFSDLKLGFSGGHAELKLAGEYSGDLVYDLAQKTLSLPALNLSASATGKAIPGGKQDLRLTGGLNYDSAQGALQLSKAQLGAAGLTINTSLNGTGLAGETPQLSGPLSIAPFNPRELMRQLGMPPMQTADAAALKEASLSAQYKGSFKSATLSDVILKLDQTTARGRIDVRDFATQAIQFALNVDQLDLDRYSATGDARSEPKSDPDNQRADGSSINDTRLPAAALDGLNAEGTLDVAQLRVKGLKISNAQVKLAGGKGQVKRQQISAKLYGGTVALNHQFTPGARPQYAVKTSLTALNAAPFLQDFLDKDLVAGLGSLNFDLSGAGLTVGDLRKALNGELALKIENGAVKGFNLGQIIRKGEALLAGQAAPAEAGPQKTDFAALSFSAKIINGILKSDSLSAASPLFRMAGEGEINLVNETINYLAKPTIVDTSKGEGGKGLEELKGLMIPIKLTGNLFSPSYKVDLKAALQQKALEGVNKKIEEKKEEFKAKEDKEKERLKQKLNDKLNKWLTPKPKPQEPAPAQPAPAETPAGT